MNSLADLYKQHKGKTSDKWEIYLVVYERLFKELRESSLRLLEIGVQNGGSLEIWSKYFPKAEKLVGCDIDEKCGGLKYDDPRVSVIVGDATSSDIHSSIANDFKSFDLILDDGSHTAEDIVQTFCRYFPLLNDGGMFVAEDLHCSYWGEFGGGLYSPYSSISFFKLLADITNHEHWGVHRERAVFLAEITDTYQVTLDESVLEEIHSVEFCNSLCVVRKQPAKNNVLGSRNVTGQDALVDGEASSLSGSFSMAPNQSNNHWSLMNASPAHRLVSLEQQFVELEEKLVKTNLELVDTEERISDLQQESDMDKKISASLTSKLHHQQQLVQNIYQSTSWRVTRPMRGLVYIARGFQRFKNIFTYLIGQYGVSGIVRKVREIKAKEGFSGLSRRLKPAVISSNDAETLDQGSLYHEWIRQFDTLMDEDRKQIVRRISGWDNPPKISVVMPTYNPNPIWLAEVIESVIDQLYENWELCIADDASTDPEVTKVLHKFEALDSRIKVVYRQDNGHISNASNSALEVATGEWVALLDHDDLIPEIALYCVADCAIKNESCQMIYSDEDKINEHGVRESAYFKSDWNSALFLSHNMFSHLGAYKTDLLKEVGGFRVGMEGSQDYDLALRCIEHVGESAIMHIPRVLYHWRIHSGSTASASDDAKPYAMIAGERAINDHLERCGIDAKAELLKWGYRVKYNLPKVLPKVTLIIPTRDAHDLLRQCLDSIREKTSYDNYEIIVVDNDSVERESLSYLKEIQQDSRISVLRVEGEFNYPALNNRAVEKATGDLIGLINNDIEVISKDWLGEMVSQALRPEIGAVGGKLLYPNDTVQHSGVIMGVGDIAGHAHKGRYRDDVGYFGRAQLVSNYSAVTAACLIIRRELYLEVGMMDEKDLKVAFNDVDLCLKLIKLGYKNIHTPYALLYHHESATRGEDVGPEKLSRLLRESETIKKRWPDYIVGDPAYSPNLSLSDEHFNLAFPPRLPSLY